MPTKKELNKYVNGGLAGILIILVVWILGSIFSRTDEDNLIMKYLNDPEYKQFAESILLDKKDLKSNPDKPKLIAATMDIGLRWYILREYELAIKWWKDGLKVEPNNEIGWYNLGNAYLEVRAFPSAESAYRKSMEVTGSGETNACLALGELYRYAYTAKKDKEDDVYLECLRKHDGNRDLIARLAIYYRDSGDNKNALLYFDKLWAIEPTQGVGEEIRKLQSKNEDENN